MQQLSEWYFVFVFFVGILGFVVSGILFFVNKNETFSSRILAGFLTALSIVALNNELMATSFFLRYPHLWRVAVPASFCVPALGFIYVRSVLQQSYRLRNTDFLFFVPAILYTLTLVPFYLMPAEKKVAMIANIINNNSLLPREPEGILPIGWGTMARVIFGLATNTAQFIMLSHWKKRIQESKERFKQNLVTFHWLFLFTVVMSSMYVLLLLMIAFQLTVYFSIWQTVIFTITGAILFICLYLLYRPSILYGMSGWLQLPAPEPIREEKTGFLQAALVEPKRFTLTEAQGTAYKEAMENHFNTTHPYLKGGYNMGELSRELNIPVHQLSAFINQEYGKNFNELINDLRVDYLEDLFKTTPEYAQFTLEAIGKEAGFNSRASFISAVKKKTGKTPSEFFGKKGPNLSTKIV